MRCSCSQPSYAPVKVKSSVFLQDTKALRNPPALFLFDSALATSASPVFLKHSDAGTSLPQGFCKPPLSFCRPTLPLNTSMAVPSFCASLFSHVTSLGKPSLIILLKMAFLQSLAFICFIFLIGTYTPDIAHLFPH